MTNTISLESKAEEELTLEKIYDNLHWGKQTTYVRNEAKIGRNENCPCESGKKYKKCCGNAPI